MKNPNNKFNKKPPIVNQFEQKPTKKLSRQALINAITEEQTVPFIVNIEKILSSKETKYKLLLFLALLTGVFLLLGDLIFILR